MAVRFLRGGRIQSTLILVGIAVGVGDKLRLDAGQGGTSVVNIAGVFQLGVRELDARYVYLDMKQTQSLLVLPGAATVIDVTVRDIFAADAVAARISRLTGLKAESWIQTNAQLMNVFVPARRAARVDPVQAIRNA